MFVASDSKNPDSTTTEELIAHFDASRTVIREALRSLESKGLITSIPSVGIRVRPMQDWNLLDPDIIEWRARAHSPQGDDQHNELRALRCVIEAFAARLAAATEHPATLRLLTDAVDNMDDALRRDQADRFDAFFHQQLMHAARSLMMLNHLSTIVSRGLSASAEPIRCDRTEASVKRHREVISALREKDSDEAEKAMRKLGAVVGFPHPFSAI